MSLLSKAATALLCAVGLPAFASNVTATVKDTDGQTWNSGTFVATLTLPGAPFRADVPKVGGVPVPAIIKGVLSASGVLTGTFTDTSTVDQAGARWVFVVCPNTSGPQCATVSTTVIGATPNLSPAFMQLPAPRFPAGSLSYGYADSEVLLPPPNGSSYYNVTLQAFRQWNGTVWTGSGGTGGAVSKVFGRIGDVIAVDGDYTASQVTNAADLSSTSQQTFLGAIKTPAFLLGSRLASTLSGDGQSIIVQADNGVIPIVPGHVLSWITDSSGGGHGAGDSGLDVANVCTATNGLCTGGGGSMTWPALAGIPNYNGSSAWGTSYSASNQIPSTFIPTLNQSTTGNAATATTAVNLSGSQIGNSFYASPNGTSGVGSWRRIVAGDIPTLNQSTSGTAANVTGTVAIANGGTGTTTPALVAGTNVTISGTWPNQTINSSGGGSSFITSLTTTGTSGPSTVASGVLNIPQYTGGGSSTPGITLAPIAYNAYGDSITIGTFNPGITLWVNRIAAALSIAVPNNFGVSGAQACDVALSALPNDVPSLTAQQPLRTLMIGTNDAVNKGLGAYETTYSTCYSGIVSYLSTPSQSKRMGGDVFTASGFTGTCTSDVTYTPNVGIDCTSSGATATFTLTTAGGPLYIWPRIIDSDAGTWTYSLDGGSAVAATTAITPAMATNNQGASSKSIGFIRIPVSAGSHTLVFTKTNATGNMAILGVGTPQGLTPNPSGPVVIAGDIPNQLQPGGASLATLAAYDADIYAAVNTLAGDNLAVYQAFPSKYVQATAAAGDMANTLHPNAFGNGELAAAFMGSSVRLVPGQQIPTSNTNLPVFFSAASQFSSNNATIVTPSLTCPVGHTMVFSMSGASTTDTLALTTSTTNTIVPIVSNHASTTRVISAWYILCDGSTGTFTGTSTGPSHNGYLNRYEAVGGHFDSFGICNGNVAPCPVIETNYGLVIAEQMSVNSTTANANVAGWTNRLNVQDNSIWDTNASSGVVSFPKNFTASVASDTLVVNLKP